MRTLCAGCGLPRKLTRHHIVPRKAGGGHSQNLALLCGDCHALVERYYWRKIAQRNPVVARGLKQLNAFFRDPANRVHPRQVRHEAMKQQHRYWTKLLDGVETARWRAWYAEAIQWSRTIEVLEHVSTEHAIDHAPWWKPKRTP